MVLIVQAFPFTSRCVSVLKTHPMSQVNFSDDGRVESHHGAPILLDHTWAKVGCHPPPAGPGGGGGPHARQGGAGQVLAGGDREVRGAALHLQTGGQGKDDSPPGGINPGQPDHAMVWARAR